MAEITPEEMLPQVMSLLGSLFANPFPTEADLDAISGRVRSLIGQIFMSIPDPFFEEIAGMVDIERQRRRGFD